MEGFGFAEIEDFWIKYFVTRQTSQTPRWISTKRICVEVHPCVNVACRSFTPIAFNGCMLLDGGYLDNLPVNEMKKEVSSILLLSMLVLLMIVHQ